MWKCDKCGREFVKQNQGHYCGEAPKVIDDYISEQPENLQPLLNQVRDTIRSVIPNAQEKISWRMPTYWEKHNIIHFAAFKNHIGIYLGDKAIEHFKERLSDYKTSKGAWQLPYDKPIPFDLIKEITKWCYDTGNHH